MKMPVKVSPIFLCGLMVAMSCILSSWVYGQGGQTMNDKLQRHVQFSEVLSEHVDTKGLVDYDKLCVDKRLEDYLNDLSATKWRDLNVNDQIAFWINAYNGFTLKVICDNYPIDSINDLHKGGLVFGTVFNSTIWDKEFFKINDEDMSLGYIEHEILRKGPEKSRIHFAIVCAAKSCPPLRQEAYEGYEINDQLNDQGYVFLRRENLNDFDLKNKRADLSGIFKWFLKDFGKNKHELIKYLSQYTPSEEISDSMKTETKQWKIRWKKYDWNLNRQ